MPESPVMSDDNKSIEHQSLTSLALEAPYRVPDQYDFARLHISISAKCVEVEDHLWMLREDPAYFAETLTEESEHSDEDLLHQ